MPLNEAKGISRSNLTRQQIEAEEAAIYGVRPSMSNTQFSMTAEQAEQMRQLLSDYDQKKGISREFDLNNPPKAPYRYQEFPRVMYNHAKGTNALAHNAEEVDDAMSHGWSKEPFAVEVAESELDASGQMEAAEVEAKIVRRKPR